MREMSAQQSQGVQQRLDQSSQSEFFTTSQRRMAPPRLSKGPGGTRRGGVEHFYRASEPPYFDAELDASSLFGPLHGSLNLLDKSLAATPGP